MSTSRSRLLVPLVSAALALGAFASFVPNAEARRVVVVRHYHYGYRAAYVAPGPILEPSGWYFGAGALGTGILNQSGGNEALHSGGGLSLYGGVRLTDNFALEAGWAASFHNPVPVFDNFGQSGTDFLVLQGLTLDAKIHFGQAGNLDPYVQGGVGAYFLGSSSSQVFDAVGSGFQLGGGFDLWLTPNWTLGLRALYRGVAMSSPNAQSNDVFLSAAQVEGNLAVHF